MPIHFTFQAILGFVRCRVSDVASVPSGKDDGVVQYHRNVDLAIDMVTKYCTYLKIKTVDLCCHFFYSSYQKVAIAKYCVVTAINLSHYNLFYISQQGLIGD